MGLVNGRRMLTQPLQIRMKENISMTRNVEKVCINGRQVIITEEILRMMKGMVREQWSGLTIRPTTGTGSREFSMDGEQ